MADRAIAFGKLGGAVRPLEGRPRERMRHTVKRSNDHPQRVSVRLIFVDLANVSQSSDGRPCDGHSRRGGIPHELEFGGCESIGGIDEVAHLAFESQGLLRQLAGWGRGVSILIAHRTKIDCWSCMLRNTPKASKSNVLE